jgi:hypothetical protein
MWEASLRTATSSESPLSAPPTLSLCTAFLMASDFPTKPARLINAAIWLWLAIWIFLLTKSAISNFAGVRQTLDLFWETPEERLQQSYGKELYEFYKLCQRILPETARFDIVGLERGAQDHSRLVYLLYPRVLSDRPEYLLVYHSPSHNRPNAHRIVSFDNGDLILQIDHQESR